MFSTFRIIGLLQFLINRFIPRKLLINEKENDELFFAYIDPNKVGKISYLDERLRDNNGFYGSAGGWWGFLNYKTRNSTIFRLAEEVINDKKGKVYRYIKKYHSEEVAEKNWNKLVSLRTALKHHGYLSQYELKELSKRKTYGSYQLPKNEACVGLNRKGEFIRLISGKHRISLAQLLNLEEIPVIILLHHPEAKKYLPLKSRLIRGEDSDFAPFSMGSNQ